MSPVRRGGDLTVPSPFFMTKEHKNKIISFLEKSGVDYVGLNNQEKKIMLNYIHMLETCIPRLNKKEKI